MSPPSSRASHVSYRADLRANYIYLNPRQPPTNVVQYARNIISTERDSPGPCEDRLQAFAELIKDVHQDGDEGTIRDVFQEFNVTPSPSQLPNMIMRGVDIPFDKVGLPHVDKAPPLAHPKPGHHYCFSHEAFNTEQHYKQSSSVLQHCSTPTSTGRWPFFTIEFKSQAKGGTLWVAENQIAGSGAQLVCSMETLLSMSPEDHNQIDYITFACTMDAKLMSVWVQYCQQVQRDGRIQQQYCSVEVESFLLSTTDGVIGCRSAIRNIIGWGIRKRLPKIITTLDQIKIEYLEAEEEKKLVRVADTPESAILKRQK